MGFHQWRHVNPQPVFWLAQMCMGLNFGAAWSPTFTWFHFHRLSYYYRVPAARHASGHWPWIAFWS
jgi:hypothetical protein